MVDESTMVVSIKIAIWELGTHSFVYEYILRVCFIFLMHPGLLNMDMVMIIFCDFWTNASMHFRYRLDA